MSLSPHLWVETLLFSTVGGFSSFFNSNLLLPQPVSTRLVLHRLLGDSLLGPTLRLTQVFPPKLSFLLFKSLLIGFLTTRKILNVCKFSAATKQGWEMDLKGPGTSPVKISIGRAPNSRLPSPVFILCRSASPILTTEWRHFLPQQN